MKFTCHLILSLCALASAAFAQDAAKSTTTLPKVVLLGDSVREHYAPLVAELLAGRATVVTPKANGRDTGTLLNNLNEWAIAEQPDVIHFNCGIHDTKQIKATGRNNVPPDQYEANLREIVKRLRAETKAKIIFALSTPLMDERSEQYWKTRSYRLANASVMEYNRIALRTMKELGVPVNDLPAALGDAAESARLHDAGGVHFTKEGSQKLAAAVASAVTTHLPVRPLCLGGGAQLLPDNHVINRLDDLKRNVLQPRRFGQPALDRNAFGVTQPCLTVLRNPAAGR
jgi:lysophospholipase L1-like esterase